MVQAKAYRTPLPHRLEGVPVVKFLVGPDMAVFHVHQNLLYDASPVFKAAFSGDFREASELSMPLPDDDKNSVQRMIQWLYTKKIELTVPVSAKTSEECYMQMAKLNTIADKYDICQLKNHIVDELFDLKKPPRYFQPPQLAIAVYVYNNTTGGSSFRKLLVAWYVYHIDLKWYDLEGTQDMLVEAPQDFAIDLARALGARLKYPDRSSPFTLPSSVYHETPPKNADEGHT